jgi:hypothetical protein
MTCWSVKGGSGTTVVAAGLALVLSNRVHEPPPVLLIDVGGDAPAALGLPEPASAGLCDWLSSQAPPAALEDLAVVVNDRLSVVPRGYGPLPSPDAPRWLQLAKYLHGRDRDSVLDCGPLRPAPQVLVEGALSILVLRPCYMALRRVASLSLSADRLVLVDEPGRALRRPDVENVVGQRVDVHLELDPAIARAVDAGLLAGRLPSQLSHGLKRVA